MKQIIAFFIAFLFCFSINAEVRIHMEKDGGVFKVPCKVNGLKMKFIFDTGASTVCMSSAYAEMMLENGYLDKSDIKGTSKSSIADGSVIDNIVINLREVEIAGLTIENVSAVVVPTQNAPLLLGQSVIQKLGRVSIDGEDLVIQNANIYTEKELDSFYDKAVRFYKDGIYAEALKYFKIVYESSGEETNPWVLYYMSVCYDNLDDTDSSVKCIQKAIEIDDGDNEDNILLSAYSRLANINSLKRNYSKSLEYSKLALKYAIDDSERARAYYFIGSNCCSLENYAEGISYLDKSINTCKSILKKRKLEYDEILFYGLSYYTKGGALEDLSRYEEAIETYTIGKKTLEKYNTDGSCQDLIDGFIKALSYCYQELAK